MDVINSTDPFLATNWPLQNLKQAQAFIAAQNKIRSWDSSQQPSASKSVAFH